MCVCIYIHIHIYLKLIGRIEAKRACGEFSKVQVRANTFSMAFEGISGSQPLERDGTFLFDDKHHAAVIHQVSQHHLVTFLCF